MQPPFKTICINSASANTDDKRKKFPAHEKTHSYFRVWKFQNFSVSQILREIKVGQPEASQMVILKYLEALNFMFDKFLHLEKAEIDQKSKLRVFKIAQNSIFRTFRISKIDFT